MKYSSAILCMHLVALLWGAAGILGAVASVDSSVLVAGRCIFALLTIFLFFGPKKIQVALHQSRKTLLFLLLAGIFMGIHWFFFFLTIQTASVALALVTYAACPAMIALGEVLLGLTPFRFRILFGTLLSFFGVFLIHPLYSMNDLLNPGFIYGILSMLAITFMALLSKKLLNTKTSSLSLTLGQMTGGLLVSLPIAWNSVAFPLSAADIFVIIGLGVFCSALGQTLFNISLAAVSVSSAAVIASMEAPYGVLLAFLILGQPLNLPTIAGVCLVTLSAIIVSLPSRSGQIISE